MSSKEEAQPLGNCASCCILGSSSRVLLCPHPTHSTIHRLQLIAHPWRRSAQYKNMASQTHNTDTAAMLNFFISLSLPLQRAGTNALNLPRETHPSSRCCAKEQRGLIMPPLPSADAPSSCSARPHPTRCLLPLRISSAPTRTHDKRAHTHMSKPMEVSMRDHETYPPVG